MRCTCILVVEDDQDIREGLVDALTTEGYTVFSASNGKEGVELLKTVEQPCLVLLDLMMPVMNGFEFLQVKRGDVTIAPTPVIVVSAVVDEAKATGANGFLKKPIDLDILMAVVRQYCGESSSEVKGK
jgi:CheY-like chemotaxis protein